jgi:integrase/recombinase XerD
MNQIPPSSTLILRGEGLNIALRNAVFLWASATTDSATPRLQDLLRDKQQAVASFFSFIRKHPADVKPIDIKSWQSALGERLASATVYAFISRLSSFYRWAMQDSSLGELIISNPVLLARPRAPKAYQTESAKALDDDQLRKLFGVVRAKAKGNDVIGKRDLALLLFYVTTGLRRHEIISLRGRDIEIKKDAETAEEYLVIKSKIKGGYYLGREVQDPSVKDALMDYLSTCRRLSVLKTDGPLWTRHDHAGRPGAPLSSHAFVKNLKRYAQEAGIEHIHLHQTRHTYARMVAEETGSITETQDALGHRNLATTRVYVQRIAVKRDKHSRRILKRLA